ncbi:MAG TPA: hypothetical protein VLH39_04030, partial [Magnetospirillaceae bacterium]|nr:hypothetical protein [Magnetospirillaceae bacterium]
MYGTLGNPVSFDRRPPRRRRKIARFLVPALGLAVVMGLSIAIPRVYSTARSRNEAIPGRDRLLAAWDSKDHDGILVMTSKGLEHRPLDPFLLVMRGFAAFHRGLGEADGEIRLQFMDDALFSLRKALAATSVPFRSQAHYILGKTYFQKGLFFMDEAARYLELALRDGFEAPDILEYLAVAYSYLGEFEKSVEAFEKAL